MKFHWERFADIWWFIAILFAVIIIGLIFAIRYEMNKKREQEEAGIQKVRLALEDKMKIVGWGLVGVACVFMFFGGIVGLALGIANPSQTKYDTEKCSWCEGDGLLHDKSCSYCDGKGYIITQDSFRFGPVLGVLGIIIGPVGYFVAFSRIKYLKENQPLYVARRSSPQQVAIPNNSRADVKELELYQSLLDMGVITKEEYEEKKKQILGL